MNKLYILAILLLSFALIGIPRASFIPLNNYGNWYNLTVNNWNYTATYGTTTFSARSAGYAMVQLPNIVGGITTLSIEGYSQNNAPQGIIPYYVVSFKNSNSIILIPNTTQNGNTWYKATIFYNPLNPFIVNQSLQNPNCVLQFCTYSYNGVNIELITNQFNNPQFTPNYSNTSYAQLNFNLTTRGIKSFVILSNQTLFDKSIFNLTWTPTNLNSFTESSNTLYNSLKLRDDGFGGGFVSNVPAKSNNANYIFAGLVQFDGKGFEGYYNLLSNQIISEGMSVNLTKFPAIMTNSTATVPTSFGYFPKQYSLNLKLDSDYNGLVLANPLLFVLPSFTTNVFLGNSVYNPQENLNGSQGFGYRYYLPIQNIKWIYNYTTYAMPAANGITNGSAFNITFNNVGYALLTVPHYKEPYGFPMGNNCQYVYFDSNALFPNPDSITFYTTNCNSNSTTATFLIPSISSQSNNFNNIRMYFSSINNITSTNNAILFNNWNFANINGNSLGTPTSIQNAGNVPFIYNLSSALNLKSSIEESALFNSPSYGGATLYNINNHYNISSQSGSGCSTGANSVADFSGLLATNGLIEVNEQSNPTYWTGNSEMGLFTPNLVTMLNNANQHGNVATAFDVFNSMGGHIYNYYCLNGASTNTIFSLSNGIVASTYRLYTTKYKLGNVTAVFVNGGFNASFPTLPPIYPNSTSRINTTNSTTINFQTDNNLSAQVTIFTGLTVSRYVLIILAIISVLIGAISFSANKDGHISFIFIIIALWIIGIWQYPILILALIVSLIYIVFESIHPKGII